MISIQKTKEQGELTQQVMDLIYKTIKKRKKDRNEQPNTIKNKKNNV